MNRLSTPHRVQILHLLVEGNSLRSTARIVGVSINTVTKLLIDAGHACTQFHDQTVTGIRAQRVQCDEIWSFCYAKQKHVAAAKSAPAGSGDVWTWTAIDADSKLIISFLVGGRKLRYALEFLDDVKRRLATRRVRLTTDGHKPYRQAVKNVFGDDVDHAQNITPKGQRRYSPTVGTGEPDPVTIGTPHVERQNLTMRMSMRRFTRLTNGFSKRLDNHVAMLALYFVHYNFCRIHRSIKTTPALKVGISDSVKNLEWIVTLIDENTPKPKKRGAYKKAPRKIQTETLPLAFMARGPMSKQDQKPPPARIVVGVAQQQFHPAGTASIAQPDSAADNGRARQNLSGLPRT